MSEIKVKTGKDESARVVTVNYDLPESVHAATHRYGEEQTLALLNRAITLALQANVRQKVAAGSDDAAVQASVDAWVPGVRAAVTKKSPFERAQAALGQMSKEELAALLAKVKEASKNA